MEYQGLKLYERDGEWYFEDPELAKWHDPKAMNRDKRDAFTQRYSLRDSQAAGASINHLLKGRIGFKRQAGGLSRKHITDEQRDYPEALGWFDHTTLFYHQPTQSYVITTQPYSLTIKKFQALEQFCQERQLACRISYEDAWWYPGRTPLVTLCQSSSLKSIFG